MSKKKKLSDKKYLKKFFKFFDRITVKNHFIETEEGLITHQQLIVTCGDKTVGSAIQELSWPVQRLPIPEAMKGKLN